MADPLPVVVLLDVDNTLLDNDRIILDLKRHLAKELGEQHQQHYWTIFERLRSELGYADYLGALQRFRNESPRDANFLGISAFLIDYPFANRLFPASLDVIDHLGSFAQTVILSDGDVVFQPRKVQSSGLGSAVGGRILIYIHKETELDDVEARFPARHYILVDDKVRILTAVKRHWGGRVTTVFPRQGHYALDAALVAANPAPDVTIARIGDLQDYGLEELVRAAKPGNAAHGDEGGRR